MAALKEAGTAVSEAAKKGVGKIKGLSKYGPAAKVVGRRAGVLLAVAEGTKAALSLLDDRLTGLARKSDNAAYIKAEAGKKAIFDRLRGQVNKLSPEQQAQLKQAVERLWAGQVHKDTGNAVFERQQVNAILQVALDQVTGKTGAKVAKKNRFALQQTRMGNAVWKAWEFGKKEDAHRDSFWGSAGGLATGRLRAEDFPDIWGGALRGGVKFAQGAMNPFSTVGSVFTGEEFPWNRPRVDDVSDVQGLRGESKPQGVLSQMMRKKEDMDDRAPPA